MSNIVIFESGDQPVQIRLEGETVWLNLQQLAALFERDKSVISRHLKNIFDTNELERDSVVAKNATTASDGKTYQVDYFNLDAIISVGYRVNSSRAIRFSQWATGMVRQHLVDSYTLISPKRNWLGWTGPCLRIEREHRPGWPSAGTRGPRRGGAEGNASHRRSALNPAQPPSPPGSEDAT